MHKLFLTTFTAAIWELICIINGVNAAELSVVYTTAATPLEKLAARELSRYVYLRTRTLTSPAAGDSLPANDCIVVARKNQPIVAAIPGVKDAVIELREQEYLLKTVEAGAHHILVIVGGDDVGTLYGAYRLAETLGIRFYLDGDVIPDQQVAWKMPKLDERGSPLFSLRGILPFHDFFEGPDWWNADDYKKYLGQMAKMRMNFIGLHNYPSNGIEFAPQGGAVKTNSEFPGGEPMVWIGLRDDVADDGTVHRSYPAVYANTTRPGWGNTPMKTSDYVAGAAMIFDYDAYGPDVMNGNCPWPATPEAANNLFNRTGRMMNDVFTFAHQLGIKTCVGTQMPLTIPAAVQNRLRAAGKDPKRPEVVRSVYEGIFHRIAKTFPLDYYWLWTDEGWCQTPKPEAVEAIKQDLQLAQEAINRVKAPFVLGTCGWVLGPPDQRECFDALLPKTSPLSCINPNVGHAPIEPAFAKVHGRPLWAIPWLENDPAMTIPQLWVGRMRYDAYDALRYGCTGLFGIQWRTKVIGPNIAALAQAGWSQTWKTGLKGKGDHRTAPIDDFYGDWANTQFGQDVGKPIAAIFERIDGCNLPTPANWIDFGPGGVVSNPQPWELEKKRYEFVDQLDSLRDQVTGPGNLERFDYWLNTFRYMRTMAEFGCAAGRLDQVMVRMQEEKDATMRRAITQNETLPLRKNLATLWCQMMDYQLAAVDTVGEMGTIANLEQHSRSAMRLVNKHDAAIAATLGKPLPAGVQLSREYVGPARIIVPTVRTVVPAGEALSLKVILLAANSVKKVSLYWRPMAKGQFIGIPLQHVARAVYRVDFPPQTEDVLAMEYYVETTWQDGKTSVWPATAPSMNQTVVIQVR